LLDINIQFVSLAEGIELLIQLFYRSEKSTQAKISDKHQIRSKISFAFLEVG